MSKQLSLENFIGQENIIEDLVINLEASKISDKALGHTIFFGPPGLGKTTLAFLVSQSIGSKFHMITGANLSTKKQVRSFMISMKAKDILFIDEIHALKQPIEELLYSPMQDFNYDGVPVQEFTLIGATTSAGQITKPLLDRMLHQYELSLYKPDEITYMLWLIDNCPLEIAAMIGQRAKGVPRIAWNLLKSIHNQQIVEGADKLDKSHAIKVFERRGIDELGLTSHDYKILKVLYDNEAFVGKMPVGSESLSLQTNIDKFTLTYIHEPYLLNIGFIMRTPKGRVLTRGGTEFLKRRLYGHKDSV